MVKARIGIIPRANSDFGPEETVLEVILVPGENGDEEMAGYQRCLGSLVRAIQEGRVCSITAAIDAQKGGLEIVFKHPH